MPEEHKCLDVPAFEAVGEGYGASKEDAFYDARSDAQANANIVCSPHEGCAKDRICAGDLSKVKRVETIPGKQRENEKVGLRVTFEAKCGCFPNV
jgi:hypothetical protein